jgi:hypothetical protein
MNLKANILTSTMETKTMVMKAKIKILNSDPLNLPV